MSKGRLDELAGAILQTVPIPVVVLDAGLRVQAANAAFLELVGEHSPAPTGRRWDELAGGAWCAPELGRLLAGVAPGQAPLSNHLVATDLPGGKRRSFRLDARPLAAGGDGALVVALEDVTERRRAMRARARERDELSRSNAALAEFASAASHDLQEPLRKVSTFVDEVLSHHASALPEEARDFLHRAVAATARMRELVNGLLVCARVSTQRPAIARVDLGLIVGEVLGDLERQLADQGGRVTVGTLPVLEADPLQMRQLFQNLVGNALKYHRPGHPPEVRISSAITADGVSVLVSDNGLGIAPQYRERVFGMFKRLHTRAEYEGTGIGLALCRAIVERHYGTLRIEAAEPTGCTFVATLPLRQPTGLEENP